MGRSNLNVSIADFLLEHKFINLCKQGQRIIRSPFAVNWFESINAHGYPTDGTGVSFTCHFPSTSGNYVAKWLGSGVVTGTSISNKINSSRGVWTGGGAGGSAVTNGRFTFTVAGLSSFITVSGTTISDVVICRADEEDAFDAGQVFRDTYLNRIAEYNPAALRYMDMGYTNANTLAEWANRLPEQYLTYNSYQFLTNNRVGLITGTNTYTAASYTGMPDTYQNGEIVHGYVENANDSTSCTLNVGGRGAKTLWFDYNAAPVATGSNQDTRLLTTAAYSFIYDAVIDKFIINRHGGIYGAPVESMVALSNATGVPGWFCLPFYASDDYAEKFAQYLCDSYNPSVVYIEYANEIWNGAAGFPLTWRAGEYGTNLFGLTGNNFANISGWYGYRFRQLADIIRSVFVSNGQGSKLKMILAGQGSQGNTLAGLRANTEDLRFQNEAVPELSGANAPILRADLVSYAIYYHGASIKWLDSEYTTAAANVPDLVAAVDDYLSEDPDLMESAFDWARNDLLNETGATLFDQAIGSGKRFENWNTLAAEYGKGVVLYEANHQIAGPSTTWAGNAPISDSSYGGATGKINTFILAFLGSHQYQTLIRQVLDYFYSFSQSEQFSIYGTCLQPPWLTFAQNNVADGGGGSIENEPFQNWVAHAKYNNGRKAMRIRLST